VLAVAAVGGVVATLKGGGGNTPGPTPVADPGFSREAWHELLLEYRDWFGALEKDLDDATMREKLSRDPHLKKMLSRLAAAQRAGGEGAFDPKKIAGLPAGTTLQSLLREEAEPPEGAQTAEAVKRTNAALEEIRAVRAALSPEAWPTLKTLIEQRDAFAARGWGAAKTTLAVHIDNLEFRRGARVAEALANLVETAEESGKAAARWAAIEAIAAKLNATGDAVLAGFEAWAAEYGVSSAGAAGIEAIKELERRLAEAEALGARLAAFVEPGGEWGGIDQELFAADSKVHKDVRGGAEVTAATFEDWLVQVRGYRSLDPALDPRAKWTTVELGGGPLGTGSVRGPEALQHVVRHHRGLTEELGAEIDAATAAAMQELRAVLDQLHTLSWNRTNQAKVTELERQATEAATRLAAHLGKQAEDRRLELAQGWEDVVRSVRGREAVVAGAADSALNTAWRRWRDALLAEVTPQGGGVGDLAELRTRARALEEVVRSLDEALPREALRPAAERPWAAALVNAAASERERLLAGLVERLGATAPAAGDAALASVLEGLRAEQAQAVERLSQLGAACARLEGLLDLGYGLAEAPAGGGETAAALAGAARQVLATFGEDVAAAVQPVLARVEALETMAQGADKAALARLVSQARADRPEEALNAWRRLGELDWPSSPAELEQELGLRQPLSSVVDLVGDAARKAALEAELEAGALARWERGVSRLSDAAAIEAAVASMDAWGVQPGQVRDGRVRYNIALAGLRRALRDPALSDERTAEEVRRFLEATAELPREVIASGAAAELRTALEALMREVEGSETPARPDVTKLGPGAVPGWTGEELDGGTAVVFRREGAGPEGPLELRFVAVQVQDQQGGAPRTVYLGETELSLRDVIALVGAERQWSEMMRLLGTDVLRGPAIWRPDGGMIARNTYWTTPHAMITDERPAFAPGLGDPSDKYQVTREQGPPSLEMPMQQIPGTAAIFLARLAGCRLPTSAEWLAAYEQLGAEAEQTVWNLRDVTWRTQQEHVRRVREEMTRQNIRGGISAFVWPDEGIFEPLGINVPSADRATSLETNDGRLFFAPVSSMPGLRLQHLVGNVAEFVFDDPAAISALARGDAEGVVRVAESGALKVIGGSALSAPEVDVRTAQSVDPLDAEVPFADVGVRLAFDAGTGVLRERLVARAARAAGPEGYLTGG
jgi:hypothetical protein